MNTPSTTSSLHPDDRRLGIFQWMVITAGIAIAFAIRRGLGALRRVPDWPWRSEAAETIQAMDLLIASVYGLSLAVFFLAVRSRPFWISPGKTLALLFANMCVLDWTLDFFASATVALRFWVDPQAGISLTAGNVLGIWYEHFSARLGYFLGLPVLILAIVRSKPQHFTWRLAWVGFLVFDLLILAVLQVDVFSTFPRNVMDWYFPIALGIPVVLLAMAFVRALAMRELDWWTVVTCLPVLAIWLVAVVLQGVGS